MTAAVISTDLDESHESFSKITSSLTFPVCKCSQWTERDETSVGTSRKLRLVCIWIHTPTAQPPEWQNRHPHLCEPHTNTDTSSGSQGQGLKKRGRSGALLASQSLPQSKPDAAGDPHSELIHPVKGSCKNRLDPAPQIISSHFPSSSPSSRPINPPVLVHSTSNQNRPRPLETFDLIDLCRYTYSLAIHNSQALLPLIGSYTRARPAIAPAREPQTAQ